MVARSWRGFGTLAMPGPWQISTCVRKHGVTLTQVEGTLFASRVRAMLVSWNLFKACLKSRTHAVPKLR